VLRHGDERHVEVGRELADRALAAREASEDLSARRIGERREREVEGMLINHMV
jgi:hypothetical protein